MTELTVDRRRILHDLNNQIVAITGHCELSLMRLDSRSAAELRHSLSTILEAAGTAASLAGLLSAEERRASGR